MAGSCGSTRPLPELGTTGSSGRCCDGLPAPALAAVSGRRRGHALSSRGRPLPRFADRSEERALPISRQRRVLLLSAGRPRVGWTPGIQPERHFRRLPRRGGGLVTGRRREGRVAPACEAAGSRLSTGGVFFAPGAPGLSQSAPRGSRRAPRLRVATVHGPSLGGVADRPDRPRSNPPASRGKPPGVLIFRGSVWISDPLFAA
jgi:hypothetical protein